MDNGKTLSTVTPSACISENPYDVHAPAILCPSHSPPDTVLEERKKLDRLGIHEDFHCMRLGA